MGFAGGLGVGCVGEKKCQSAVLFFGFLKSYEISKINNAEIKTNNSIM